jgi:hypothetical protein
MKFLSDSGVWIISKGSGMILESVNEIRLQTLRISLQYTKLGKTLWRIIKRGAVPIEQAWY